MYTSSFVGQVAAPSGTAMAFILFWAILGGRRLSLSFSVRCFSSLGIPAFRPLFSWRRNFHLTPCFSLSSCCILPTGGILRRLCLPRPGQVGTKRAKRVKKGTQGKGTQLWVSPKMGPLVFLFRDAAAPLAQMPRKFKKNQAEYGARSTEYGERMKNEGKLVGDGKAWYEHIYAYEVLHMYIVCGILRANILCQLADFCMLVSLFFARCQRVHPHCPAPTIE